jgi:hypothetical protein
MFLSGSIDLASWSMTITGDPLFDFFFTLMVIIGICAGGVNAILSFFS